MAVDFLKHLYIMKALCVTAYGSPASVQAAFPRPQISEGFVLLKVSKASVNPIDFKVNISLVCGTVTSHFVFLNP